MSSAVSPTRVVEAFGRVSSRAGALSPKINEALQRLESGEIFKLQQGLALASMVLDLKPDVIVDLGTGSGASSFSMAIAAADWPAKVYTFDINDNWNWNVKRRVAEPPPSITPVMADITKYDFTSLLQPAERVFVFLDAHGFEVAARLLSHIMPLIADKPHYVFCHDISDNRRSVSNDDFLSYKGKRMWRGAEDYFENINDTAYVNIGWMTTGVDQAIALGDFCIRNRITFGSVDQEFHAAATQEQRAAIHQAWNHPAYLNFALTYFTMQDTSMRNFPRC